MGWSAARPVLPASTSREGEVVGGGVRGGGALYWRVRGAVRHRGDGLMRCGVAWMLVVWVRWLLERLGEVEHRGVI